MARFKQLSEKSVDIDPLVMFEKWFRERINSGILYPEAFSLATASPSGEVSVRTVLLKDFGNDGFVFFTNYSSKKGRQLEANPMVAMLFYWPEKGRQIRVEGVVNKVSAEDSFRYFSSRPRKSRIGAWASNQSSPIPGRDYLEKRFSEFKMKFRGIDVPLPPSWGGYRVTPSSFEFWQEGRHRLHDRILYSSSADSWNISRLSP